MSSTLYPLYVSLDNYTQSEEDVYAGILTGKPYGYVVIYNTAICKSRVWNGTVFINSPYVQTIQSPYIFLSTSNQVVTNTTTETTLLGTGIGTKTIPIGYYTVGVVNKITLIGFFNKGVGNMSIRIKVGGVTVASFLNMNTGVANNIGFELNFILTCIATGVSGQLIGQGKFVNYGTGSLFPITMLTSATVNTDVAVPIDVTIQYASLNIGNTITVTNAMIEILK